MRVAKKESLGFERVEQVHEHAVVGAHQLGQFALATGPVGQQVEDAQLARLQIVLGENLADVALFRREWKARSRFGS